MSMQFKAIVDGKQVGKPSTDRNGCWNLLLEYSSGEFGWKFESTEGERLHQGTVTKLTYDAASQSWSWATVPYEIIPVE
jgi:hypothetical protein